MKKLWFIAFLILITNVAKPEEERRRIPNHILFPAMLEEAYQARKIYLQIMVDPDGYITSSDYFNKLARYHELFLQSKGGGPRSTLLDEIEGVKRPSRELGFIGDYLEKISDGTLNWDSVKALLSDELFKSRLEGFYKSNDFSQLAYEWCLRTGNKGPYYISIYGVIGSAYLLGTQKKFWVNTLPVRDDALGKLYKKYEFHRRRIESDYNLTDPQKVVKAFDFFRADWEWSQHWQPALLEIQKIYEKDGFLDQIFEWRGIESPLAEFRKRKQIDLSDLGFLESSEVIREQKGKIKEKPLPKTFNEYLTLITENKVNLDKLKSIYPNEFSDVTRYDNAVAAQDWGRVALMYLRDTKSQTDVPYFALFDDLGYAQLLADDRVPWIFNIKSDQDAWVVYGKYRVYRDRAEVSDIDYLRKIQRAVDFLQEEVSRDTTWEPAKRFIFSSLDKYPCLEELFRLKDLPYPCWDYKEKIAQDRKLSQSDTLDLMGGFFETIYQAEKVLDKLDLSLSKSNPERVKTAIIIRHEDYIKPLLQVIVSE